MYNLANSVTLLEKLDLNLSSIVEVYDVHLGMWGTENVNCVFQVVSQQKIFVRLQGVLDCPLFEQLSVAETSLSPCRASRKRKLSNASFGEDDLPSPKRLRPGSATFDSTSTPSPASLLSTVDTTASTPFPLTAISAASSSASALSAVDDSHSPAGLFRWPGDMYTCDAANKICRVVKAIKSTVAQSSDSTKRVEQAFKQEFPEYIYVKSSFARHLKAWRSASIHVREEALRAPGDAQNCWSSWYSQHHSLHPIRY
jgi:hypothetical protein